MDHYIDIKVMPDLETTAQTLMNNLYAKLHRMLGTGQLGVSFPRVDLTLGDTLRIHGSTTDVHQLMRIDWIAQLKDYVRCSEILPVPPHAKHRTVKRVQIKSMHNKRQRSIRKGWLTEAQALEKMPDHLERPVQLPFAQIRSLSTKQVHRIYMQHGDFCSPNASGLFNSYGLSATKTIPWF